MSTIDTIIELAASRVQFAAMRSSAQICLDDARRLANNGKIHLAAGWAVRSLSYSVGVFSPDHTEAKRLAEAL